MLYCLCGKANGILFDEGDTKEQSKSPEKVLLKSQMHCIKTGAKQFVEAGGVHRHYPNVDVFKCQFCGAIIAKE